MSEDLGEVCDDILISSGIADHAYGIPQFRGGFADSNELQTLENEYHVLYEELITKLNRLIYLNELKELKSQSESSIEQKYEEVRGVLSSVSSDDPHEFLESSVDSYKTSTLLVKYLQVVLPILSAIHKSNPTLTESGILNNLTKLYSLKDGVGIKFIDEFNRNEELSTNVAQLSARLRNFLSNEVKAQVSSFNESNSRLMAARQRYLAEQRDKVDDMTKTEKHKQKEFIDALQDLVGRWDQITFICDLLPCLITALPVNWFADETLFSIIKDCELLSEKTSRYQQLINSSTIKSSAIEDLLMINFEELV